MNEFAILNSRKRGIIALAHSVAFLLLATWQITGNPVRGIFSAAHVSTGTWAIAGIYVVVSVILLWLFGISRGWMEKLYFAFCAISATSGLVRTIVGDQQFHSGRFLRVVMLTSAVIIGILIVRLHSTVLGSKSEA